MSLTDGLTDSRNPCLVLVRPEPPGLFTAELVGLGDLHVTAATREAAVEGVRSLLKEWIEAGKLVSVGMAAEEPIMGWFGHARDDPDFTDYLEEIRRGRLEANTNSLDPAAEGECSDTSSTPTT